MSYLFVCGTLNETGQFKFHDSNLMVLDRILYSQPDLKIVRYFVQVGLHTRSFLITDIYWMDI